MEQLHIGIDIGGTNLRGGLVDRAGCIRQRFRTSSDIAQGLEPFLSRLLSGIDVLHRAASAENGTVAGIGIGVPGLIGNDGCIHSSVNMRPLEGIRLAAVVEQRAGITTLCANDANMVATGEQMFGAGREFASFVVITIGTGLGSGLILNKSLWTGSGGFAAEFGHMTVEPAGSSCTCGNQGCLEQYVSAGALVRAMRTRCLASGRPFPVGLDAAGLAILAREGDHDARSVFCQAGEWLGIALASLDNLLDLEAAIISGGVSASLDLMVEGISRVVAARTFPQIGQRLQIRRGELGDDAGLCGAAAMAANRGETSFG